MARYRVLLFLLLLLSPMGSAQAHEITALSVVADLKGSGEYSLNVGVDVKLVRDPFGENDTEAAEIPPLDPSAPLTEEEIAEVERQVGEYIASSLRFYFDGAPFVPAFRLEEEKRSDEPDEEDVGIAEQGQAPQRRYNALAAGGIPEGTKEFLLEATPDAKAPVVLIIFKNGKPTRRSQVLYSGEFSRPVELASLEALPEAKVQKESEQGAIGTAVGDDVIFGGGPYQDFVQGFGHVLFVLGMLLLSRKWRPLFWQVAAFTAGLSLALTLAMTGVMEQTRTISYLAAILVPVSVIYVGVDNVFAREQMKWWRPVAVFVLGLAHGIELDPLVAELTFSEVMVFNVFVGLGELTILGAGLLALYPFRGLANYHRAIVVPISLAIAAGGVVLLVI